MHVHELRRRRCRCTRQIWRHALSVSLCREPVAAGQQMELAPPDLALTPAADPLVPTMPLIRRREPTPVA
jgi:hypothetical protein